jgi:polysaccharide biosynthesis/export protein
MRVSLFSFEKKGHGAAFALMMVLALIFSILLCGCATLQRKPENAQEATRPASDEAPQGPKGNDFILGPGDKIVVEVYRQDNLTKTIQVDPSGKITYPWIGDMEAAGLSISQLKDRIQAGLAKYFVDPQVSVNISSVRSQNVVILGEVKNPGLYSADASYTALDVIALAGGFTMNAKSQNVLLIRGGSKKPELVALDLKKVFTERDMTQNVSLQKGDILYVPVKGMEMTARFFDHLQRILAPFAQITSSGLVITSTVQSNQNTTTK